MATGRTRRGLLLALVAVAALISGGCWNSISPSPSRFELPPDIHHVVLFKLNDAKDADALSAELRALLARWQGGVLFGVGPTFDAGRPQSVKDFDVALDVTFKTIENYESYLVWDEHQALIERWRSRVASIRVIDFTDDPVIKDPSAGWTRKGAAARKAE